MAGRFLCCATDWFEAVSTKRLSKSQAHMIHVNEPLQLKSDTQTEAEVEDLFTYQAVRSLTLLFHPFIRSIVDSAHCAKRSICFH